MIAYLPPTREKIRRFPGWRAAKTLREDDLSCRPCGVGRVTAGAGSLSFRVFNAEMSGVSHLEVRRQGCEMPVMKIGNICRHGEGPRQEDAVAWFARSG